MGDRRASASPALRASLAEQLRRLRGDAPLPAPLLDVAIERMPLPGGAVAVARPRNWAALREAERAAGRDTPYWGVPWPSGIALAGALAREGAGLAGRRVLELGCGLGLASLAAARAGATVVALDAAPEAVVFAAHNLALNELEGEAARADFAEAPAGEWDLVVAADVLYLRTNVELLLRRLPRLVPARGEAWLADPGRVGAEEFLGAAKRIWRVRSDRDPDRPQVSIHRLTRRG